MLGFHISNYLADLIFENVKKSKLLQKEILCCLNQSLPSYQKWGNCPDIPVLPAMRQSLPTPLPLNGIMTNKISCFHPKVLIQVLMNTRNILISFVKTLRTR